MKACVEAGNLRHVWHAVEDRFNGCQIVRLMQRSKRNQLIEFGQNLPGHDCWAVEPRSTMDDTVTNTQYACATVSGPEPGSQLIERITTIANLRIQFLVGEGFSVSIFDR